MQHAGRHGPSPRNLVGQIAEEADHEGAEQAHARPSHPPKVLAPKHAVADVRRRQADQDEGPHQGRGLRKRKRPEVAGREVPGEQVERGARLFEAGPEEGRQEKQPVDDEVPPPLQRHVVLRGCEAGNAHQHKEHDRCAHPNLGRQRRPVHELIRDEAGHDEEGGHCPHARPLEREVGEEEERDENDANSHRLGHLGERDADDPGRGQEPKRHDQGRHQRRKEVEGAALLLDGLLVVGVEQPGLPQVGRAQLVGNEPHKHAEARQREAPVPAVILGQPPAERRP